MIITNNYCNNKMKIFKNYNNNINNKIEIVMEMKLIYQIFAKIKILLKNQIIIFIITYNKIYKKV